MGRSSATWFVIALVMGTIAFVATLIITPLPSERPLSEEERAERLERQRIQGIIRQYERSDRMGLIVAGDWHVVHARAREVVELDPTHIWAQLDLLHAIDRTVGPGPELEARAEALLEMLDEPAVRQSRAPWQLHAARGWSSWFLGDEMGAREAWLDAADTVGGPNGANPHYNSASYLSLAGEVDRAIEHWREALEQTGRGGWGVSVDYARADYDNVRLVTHPGFEAAIEDWNARRAAAQAEREALEAQHEQAHPPIASTSEPEADDPAPGADAAPATGGP